MQREKTLTCQECEKMPKRVANFQRRQKGAKKWSCQDRKKDKSPRRCHRLAKSLIKQRRC